MKMSCSVYCFFASAKVDSMGVSAIWTFYLGLRQPNAVGLPNGNRYAGLACGSVG
jgi:hypothetical protein